MSSDNSNGKFDHLLLPKRLAGTAKLTGRSKGHDQTKTNKESYKLHSGFLNGKIQRIEMKDGKGVVMTKGVAPKIDPKGWVLKTE